MNNRPNRPIYLDNQATTQCDPRVVQVMLPFFTEHFGNPHSAEHAMGRFAEEAVETARGHVAALIGADAPAVLERIRHANSVFGERIASPEFAEAASAFMTRRPADFSRLT